LFQHCCVVNRDELTRHGGNSWSKVAGQWASFYFTTAWHRPEATLSDRLLGIALTLRLIPPEVMSECREQARSELVDGRPVSRAAAVVVAAIWLGLAALAGVLIARTLFVPAVK
jgi:hypothetical protein